MTAASQTTLKVWLNGRLVNSADATIRVDDHGLLYGDGIFEGVRIYRGRIFKLMTHLHRFYESARSIRLPMPYSIDQLAAAMRDVAAANPPEVREAGYLRLCATRGRGTLGLDPFVCKDASVFIIADKLSMYPKDMYENGMSIITAATIRNHPAALSPRIKSLNYLNNILAKIEACDAGVPEAVMLNHLGFVAECTGDNLFIVRRGELLTPPLHAGVLEGVTMNVVIELAEQTGVAFRRTDLTRHDLYTADEMFLTGTGAEVIPVTEVDKRAIGSGKPGPITRKLIDAFRNKVNHNAPED